MPPDRTFCLALLSFVLSLLALPSALATTDTVRARAKSVLEDVNQIPPNIYQWIEENAHICTTVPLNGANAINFLNAEEGARCSLCPEPRAGQAPKVACAVEVRPNSVDLDIGCHQIPELCVLDLRERYAEFFIAGGKMPKAPRPTPDAPHTNSDEIFQTTGDPFVEENTLAKEFRSTITPTPAEETTTIRADQFTPDAGSGVFVNISTSDISASKNAARIGPRRPPPKKRPDENVFAPAPNELAPITRPLKRTGKRPVDDDKNVDDRDQKAATCRDKHELCCFWASAGECDQNPFWMRLNCAKTCGTCNCKVRNANKCVSTGVECQTTTISSTRPTSSSSFTSTALSTAESSEPSSFSTSESSTSKGRVRPLPRNKPRGPRPRRPLPSPSSGNQPPGHRPQRPPLSLSRPSTTTVGIDDPDYRSPDTLDGDGFGGGDYGNSGDGSDGDDLDDEFDGGEDDQRNGHSDYGGGDGDDDDNFVTSTPSETSSSSSSSSTPSSSTTRVTCFNYNRLCRFWADLGECERNPFWMRPHCQKACNSCGETVEDVLTPPQRPGCENRHTFCPFWTFIGECSANARWMSTNCRASCQLC